MHHLSSVSRWMLVVLPLVFSMESLPLNLSNDEVEMMTANTNDRKRATRNAAVEAAPVLDLEMQVHIIGEGPPLVLVGGGLTGWKSWEPHAEQLADTRTVARLQLLNVEYGLEDRPLPQGYSARMESAALAAALDGLGWREPLDLVAWSYGALITLDFALGHPARVRTLTLIEPPAAWVLPDRGKSDPDLQALRSLDIGEDVSEADLERFLRIAGLIPPESDPRELPQWSVWMEHRRSLRAVVNPVKHHDEPERLRTFEPPVLLITGTGTAPYYRRIQEMLVAHLPRARAVEMPAGHAPHIISSDRFLAELARFHESAVKTE